MSKLFSWWRNLPVSKKLNSVVSIMFLLIMVELFTLMFAMDIISAARAFVGGEGLWSKAQKNAVLEMQNYITTRDKKHYQAFLNNMRIPLGDRKARLALEKPELNFKEVENGFIEGRNHPKDIPSMIRLMRYFNQFEHLQQAIIAWRKADAMADELLKLGTIIHQSIENISPYKQVPNQKELLFKLSQTNETLTELEDEFSYSLGEATRWVEKVLALILLIAVLTIESTGLYLTFRFSHNLTKALGEINDTATKVGAGDFTKIVPVRSSDELGQLALAVNKMSKNLNEITSERQHAEEANQVKSLFLANMSHELRTPLGAMLGFVELLKDPDTSENEKKKFLEIISRTGNTLLSIINDILDVSKVEAGKIEIKNEVFSLTRMLKDLQLLLELRCQEKGISLNLYKKSEIPAVIETDPLRVRQILLNIVGNAIKFTNVGSVDLIYKIENSELLFSVIDTGDGIASENEKKLFKDFSQGDLSIRKSRSGTGLGLSLSRKLARLMNGDVYLKKSQLGVGSHFVIRIPINCSEKIQPANNITPLRQIMSADCVNLLKNIHILLVEDSPENQTLILLFLKKSGALVQVANNGLEALEKVKFNTPDLILMDMQMPVMDGYTATEKLRSQGYNLPIIALTANAMKEDLNKSLAAGCNEIITKPVQRNELIQQIARIYKDHQNSQKKVA